MSPVRHPFEFEGVVRVTKIGATFILTTVILAIAAVNTGNNALYIGVSLMLGSLILSGVASKGGLKHLELEAGAIDEAWAGKPAHGELRIRNRSRIWNVRDVVIVSPDLAAPVFVSVLPRRQDIVVPASFLFQRRGLAELRSLDAYTRYPFGFVLKKRRMRVHSDVVVFPRILSEDVARERFRAIVGEQSGDNRPGLGTEVHSFRDFVRGDTLRQVYWKKSASLGRWIVKQTEAEAAKSVHVVVDPYKPRGVSHDDFEELVSLAATFIYDVVGRDFDVTLSLPRVDVRMREGEPPAPLFRALALLDPVFEPVYHAIDRNTVFFSISGGRRDAKSA